MVEKFELTELDRKKIIESIKDGNNRGFIGPIYDNRGRHVYWELKKNIWYGKKKICVTEIPDNEYT